MSWLNHQPIWLWQCWPIQEICQALAAQDDIPAAVQRLAQIRRLVGVNLILGLSVAVVAVGGRYW